MRVPCYSTKMKACPVDHLGRRTRFLHKLSHLSMTVARLVFHRRELILANPT